MPEITVGQAEMMGRLADGARGALAGINERRKARGLAEVQLCPKCNGAGVFTCWAHIEAGVCFACRGAQYMTAAQVAGYYRGVERAAARAAHADFRQAEGRSAGFFTAPERPARRHSAMGRPRRADPVAAARRRYGPDRPAPSGQVAPGSRWSDSEWAALNRGR